jgi:hypothetical protein
MQTSNTTPRTPDIPARSSAETDVRDAELPTGDDRSALGSLQADLIRFRDTLELQAHLGKMELSTKLTELRPTMQRLEDRATKLWDRLEGKVRLEVEGAKKRFEELQASVEDRVSDASR